MKQGLAAGQKDRKRWRWGVLMGGAFLAGLLAVGAVLLSSGGDRKEPAPSSAFTPPPPAPAGPPVPAPPVSSAGPRLAIVVDDLGYEPSRDAEWLKFPEKLTLAVLPFGPSSRGVAESARAKGWSVLLHVPMEPESEASDRTERFRFRRGMTTAEMEALLGRMVADLPQAKGVSNHMGSAFTADRAAMKEFAALLKERGLFFLDSMTSPRSVALETATEAGIPAARRDVFLDTDMNGDEMRKNWNRAVAMAKEKGMAILICHGRLETLRLALDLLPALKAEKVQLVTLEDLLAGGRG